MLKLQVCDARRPEGGGPVSLRLEEVPVPRHQALNHLVAMRFAFVDDPHQSVAGRRVHALWALAVRREFCLSLLLLAPDPEVKALRLRGVGDG